MASNTAARLPLLEPSLYHGQSKKTRQRPHGVPEPTRVSRENIPKIREHINSNVTYYKTPSKEYARYAHSPHDIGYRDNISARKFSHPLTYSIIKS